MTGEETLEEVLRSARDRRELILEFQKVISGKLSWFISDGESSYQPQVVEELLETFASVFQLPMEAVSPLREVITGLDLRELPKGEFPIASSPYTEEELRMLLFVLARPYFLSLNGGSKADASWEGGRCPVCGSAASVASLDEGRRSLHCPYCEAAGEFRRTGCPFCLEEDTSKITILEVEGEGGIRIDTCDSCKSYIKTMKGGLSGQTAGEADLMSLHLDIIAQQRGYRRPAPNPLGMVRMIEIE
ncbi:MAG: formate dehydrogenase accessory protein FdhE [Thermodesulfovibrionales bacterium]|jgi:FdhE protein